MIVFVLIGVVLLIFALGVALHFRYLSVAVDCDHAAMAYHLFYRGDERRRRQGHLFNLCGVWVINRIAYGLFGMKFGYSARMFFLLWLLAASAVMMLLVAPVAGTSAALAAALLFLFVTACPAVEPHNDCSEKYAMLPLGLGYAALSAALLTGSDLWLIPAAALFMAVPMLAKATDLIHLAAIPLSVGLDRLWSSPGWIAGTLLAAAAMGSVVALRAGSLWSLVRYAGQARRMTLKQFVHKISIFLVPFLLRTLPLFAFFVYAAAVIPSADALMGTMLIWFALGWVAIIAQGRFHGYHFFVVLPPLAVGAAVGATLWAERFAAESAIVQAAGGVGLLWLAGSFLLLWKEVVFASSDSLHRLLWGRLGEYYYWEGAAAAIGDYVRARTGEDDYVLQWGDTHQVYIHSGRRAATRHWCGKYCFNMWGEQWVRWVIADVTARPPALVVLMRKEIDMNVFEELTGLGYLPETVLVWKGMEIPVYRLRSRRPAARSLDALTRDDCLRFFRFDASVLHHSKVVLA